MKFFDKIGKFIFRENRDDRVSKKNLDGAENFKKDDFPAQIQHFLSEIEKKNLTEKIFLADNSGPSFWQYIFGKKTESKNKSDLLENVANLPEWNNSEMSAETISEIKKAQKKIGDRILTIVHPKFAERLISEWSEFFDIKQNDCYAFGIFYLDAFKRGGHFKLNKKDGLKYLNKSIEFLEYSFKHAKNYKKEDIQLFLNEAKKLKKKFFPDEK